MASVSGWTVLKRALRPWIGKVGAILFTAPLWKIIWEAIDAYGNVRMIADNARTVLSFLASWPGAIGLMTLGCFLLWLQIKKQQSVSSASPDDLDGEGLQPEILIDMFRTSKSLIVPHLNQPMTTTGVLDEVYRGKLKQSTISVLLKRRRDTSVIAHLAAKHRDLAYQLRRDSEVTVSGTVEFVDQSSVTLDECEVVRIKPQKALPDG